MAGFEVSINGRIWVSTEGVIGGQLGYLVEWIVATAILGAVLDFLAVGRSGRFFQLLVLSGHAHWPIAILSLLGAMVWSTNLEAIARAQIDPVPAMSSVVAQLMLHKALGAMGFGVALFVLLRRRTSGAAWRVLLAVIGTYSTVYVLSYLLMVSR